MIGRRLAAGLCYKFCDCDFSRFVCDFFIFIFFVCNFFVFYFYLICRLCSGFKLNGVSIAINIDLLMNFLRVVRVVNIGYM